MKNQGALGLILYLVFVTGSLAATKLKTQVYQEVGCYNDQRNHDLEYYAGADPNMEPGMCRERCADYPFFGIYDTEHCYCGHKYGKYEQAEMSECDTKCAGDPKYNCGGTSKTYVYANHFYDNGWDGVSYLGCFQFKFASVATTAILQTKDMTMQKCHNYCKGHQYLAIKNTKYCRCSNKMGLHYFEAPGKCNTTCAGNGNQMCGGYLGFGVYDLKRPL